MTDLKCMLGYLLFTSSCISTVVGQSFLVSVKSVGSGVFLGVMTTPFLFNFVTIQLAYSDWSKVAPRGLYMILIPKYK